MSLNLREVNPLLPVIRSIELDQIKVHALVTGWVKVRQTHLHSGISPYLILFDPRWTDWMPIFSWVIEHPEGVIVIDTGENTRIKEADYLNDSGFSGWLNKKLARYEIAEQWEIGPQLAQLNIKPEDVRWVVLTHLHVDHTDGLKYFPKSEIIVSHQEYVRPFCAVEATFPKWFKPHSIGHFDDGDSVFKDAYVLTKAGDVVIVPTPGHTFGHQSVILKMPHMHYFFAGDTSFSFEQMRTAEAPGICFDRAQATATLHSIKKYCSLHKTAYLPSHDMKSVERFFEKQKLQNLHNKLPYAVADSAEPRL